MFVNCGLHVPTKALGLGAESCPLLDYDDCVTSDSISGFRGDLLWGIIIFGNTEFFVGRHRGRHASFVNTFCLTKISNIRNNKRRKVERSTPMACLVQWKQRHTFLSDSSSTPPVVLQQQPPQSIRSTMTLIQACLGTFVHIQCQTIGILIV